MEINGSFVHHKGFNMTSKFHDIGLIKLERPVDRRIAIDLCDASYENSVLAVCGLGAVNGTTGENPDVLQEVESQEFDE